MPITFSIVTPSFRQARFLPGNLASVASQGAEVEHLVIDGGSDDGSVELLRQQRAAAWTSEPDQGQSHALEKGFARSTGTWLAWLNSDDEYLPGALEHVRELAEAGATWVVGATIMRGRDGREANLTPTLGSGAADWVDFVRTRETGATLPQQSSFWTRAAFDEAGGIDRSMHYAMDHDLWTRLARAGHRPTITNRALAVMHMHDQQKTALGRVPFFVEELRVVDKSLRVATAGEYARLRRYRRVMVRSLQRERLRVMSRRVRRLSPDAF